MKIDMSPALIDAYAEEVLTIASCWRLKRVDGTEFYFTDHQSDLVIDGNTYKAATGFLRTAIQQKDNLAVNNMSVEGIVDSEDITEEDLRAGLYNNAEMWFFEVDYENLNYGKAKLDYGNLGEVEIGGEEFRVEFRTQAQKLDQEIIDKYGRYCRNILGDVNCGVTFGQRWIPKYDYVLNDWVTSDANDRRFRCTTPGTSSVNISVPYADYIIANPKTIAYYRLDETSGTTLNDTVSTYNGIFNGVDFNQEGVIVGNTPSVGFNISFSGFDYAEVADTAPALDNLFDSGPESVEIWFRIPTVTQSGNVVLLSKGLPPTNTSGNSNFYGWNIYYDANVKQIFFHKLFKANSSGVPYHVINYHPQKIQIEENYHLVVTYDSSSLDNYPILYLNNVAHIGTELPPPTGYSISPDTSASFRMGRSIYNDDEIRAWLDEVAFYSPALTEAEIQTNYENGLGAIADEPTWNLTIGGTTNDGTVVWTTEYGLKASGAVTIVSSNSQFQSDDLVGYDDNWFNRGVITFTSGLNNGLSIDIKLSDTTGQINLLRLAAFQIQVGDTFNITSGCNHILKSADGEYTGDCIVKFNNAANFNGEPEIPGENSILGGQ